MRDIKFRAWHKETKVLYEWEWLDEDNNIILNIWKAINSQKYSNADFILMQYTGIKDNNGKEIYEGDIVSSEQAVNGKIFEVEWGFDSWILFNRKEDERFDNGDYYEGFVTEWGCEVIGNIYENPDLLKD